MEPEYIVAYKDGSQGEYMSLTDIAIEYGLSSTDFEYLKRTLREQFGDTLVRNKKVELVDKREQAIYKRLCGIKRPRPKGEFKKGDKVRIIWNRGGDYFNQFIGQTKKVIEVYNPGEVGLNIPSEGGEADITGWKRDEIELVEAGE